MKNVLCVTGMMSCKVYLNYAKWYYMNGFTFQMMTTKFPHLYKRYRRIKK